MHSSHFLFLVWVRAVCANDFIAGEIAVIVRCHDNLVGARDAVTVGEPHQFLVENPVHLG